ncbi:MAG: hypothetical protein ACTSRS_19315, partial [Candidatus Helarchaeota archaeon]
MSQNPTIKQRILEYLNSKNIKIDPALLKYLDGDIQLTDQDEFMHPMSSYPLHHNESWYFNCID